MLLKAVRWGIASYVFFSAMGLFAVWLPWLVDCKPITVFDPARHPSVSIPPNAECFAVSHGSIAFYSETGQWANTMDFLFYSVVGLLPACIVIAYGVFAIRSRISDK